MTIPDDILSAAVAVVDRGYNVGLIDAVAEALMAERKAENQRWKDSDEAARESGLMLSPFDLAEAVMNERERCAKIAEAFDCWDDEWDDLTPEDAIGRNVAAKMIASRIRSPDTGPST